MERIVKQEDENNPDSTDPMKSNGTEDPSPFCVHCGDDPCVVEQLEEMLLSLVRSFRGVKSNKQLRHYMYTNSIRFIHGPNLGKGVRKRIPHCLQKRIHALCPDKVYTGFIPGINDDYDE